MALILLDGLADTLCLMMMLRLTGRRIRPLRVVLAAALGTMIAEGLHLAGLSRAKALLFWLPTAYLMAGMAGGRWRIGAMLALLGCEGLLGGTVLAIAGATGSLRTAWVVGGAAVSLMAIGAMRERRLVRDVRTARVYITFAKQTVAVDALVDTGNSLRDYLTHRPVIVMPEGARVLFGLEGAALRPIFADTAGGRLMMDCFTPRCTLVETGGQRLAVRACVAFSPGLGKGAPALLPQSLLEQGDGAIERADIEGDAYGKAEG